jgi:hypothetical protein
MRILQYFVLAVLVIAIPYITTIICIMITGDRIQGMKLGAIPGLALPHILFGWRFIKRSPKIKVIVIPIVMVLIFGLIFLMAVNEMIRTGWDIYGVWDLKVSNLIAGLIIWEIFYHIDASIGKRVTS